MDAIYLDHAATTPVRAEVRAAMEPYLSDAFGNPSSAHRWGRRAAAALESARAVVAAALGADRPAEIVFTRGGTESDNLAVLGRAEAARREGRRPRVLVSAIEHHAVLEAAEAVADAGGEAVVLGVAPNGTLDFDALDQGLAGGAAVVSLLWVNNETGTLLPIARAAEVARRRGVPLHSDAVQAIGKVPVRVDEVAVDLLTLTGHKIYGPKGTGALYVREGTALAPLIFGGGQERGLRPGTQDVAGAVGLAEAVRLAVAEQPAESARLGALRNLLEIRLGARIEGLRVHGADGPRAPHVSNVGVPGADQEALLIGMDLEGVAVSSGSACQSGAHRASHVLRALYGDDADRFATLRFSLGRATTEGHVERAAEIAAQVVERARATV